MSGLQDTPVRPTRTLTATRVKMTVRELAREAQHDLRGKLRFTPTSKFLEKLLTSSTSIDTTEILQSMSSTGQYSDSRWKDYPASAKKGQENKLYKPFVGSGNAIHNYCLEKIPPNSQSGIKDGGWFDRHSQTPHSLDNQAPASRPDCLFASCCVALLKIEAQMNELDKQISKIEEEIKVANSRNAASDNPAPRNLEKDLASRKQSKTTLLAVWWVHVHVPVEFKSESSTAAMKEAMVQLLTYTRHILMEQLDRRFVIGLVVCHDLMWILLNDRSGVLATETPIDINKEPILFVQVMANLSMLSPELMGWDTGMMVYKEPGFGQPYEAIPSYSIGADEFTRIYGESKYHTHWIFEVKEGGELKKYVSAQVLSAFRSPETCTRATLAFVVLDLTDNKHLNPTDFRVLKRYWRPDPPASSDEPSAPLLDEGAIIDFLDSDKIESERRVYAHHDITIGGDSDVDSTERLRHGIPHNIYSREMQSVKVITTAVSGDQRAFQETEIGSEDMIHLRLATEEALLDCFNLLIEGTHTFQSRVHTQLLMPKGEHIKYFSDLHELVECFRDFLLEHENAYYKGVLHRDISSGNLMVFPRDDPSGKKMCGRLMDFDHAKVTREFIPSPSTTLTNSKVLDIQVDLAKEMYDISVTTDVIKEAVYCDPGPPDVARYVWHARTERLCVHQDMREEEEVTVSALKWIIEEKKSPNFNNRKPRYSERTGTLPFMSPEVIGSMFIYPPEMRIVSKKKLTKLSAVPFVHTALHDIESLLWVFVHICITRGGPGIRRFIDVDSDPGLFGAILDYFDGNEQHLQKTKTALILDPETFGSKVLDHFHDYFDPLKPLVRQWWSTLAIAHRYHGNEYYHIHAHVKRLLEIHLLDLVPTLNDPLTEKELTRRSYSRNKILDTFKPSRSTTPPPTTSSSCNAAQASSSPTPSQISPLGDSRAMIHSTSQVSPSARRPQKKQREG